MRKQTRSAINGNDWKALKHFEHIHPELYTGAKAPRGSSNLEAMVSQMDAFNVVFDHPQYGEEFKAMIERAKKGRL